MSRRTEYSEDIRKKACHLSSNPANNEPQRAKGKSKKPWTFPTVAVDWTSDDEEEQVIHRFDAKVNPNQDDSSDGGQENVIKALRRIIHKQAEMIQKLDRDVLEMRQNAGQLCSCQRNVQLETDDMLTYINCKIDLLIEQVLYIAKKVSNERRCRGYCLKHVRTKKCLCRGFEQTHRCCGQIGSICDC